MNYLDFYGIVAYINCGNRSKLTEMELAETAHIYCVDFELSKVNGEIAHNIQELAKILAEDDTDEARDWLYRMATELGLLDMDFMDYMETDADIVSMFLG